MKSILIPDVATDVIPNAERGPIESCHFILQLHHLLDRQTYIVPDFRLGLELTLAFFKQHPRPAQRIKKIPLVLFTDSIKRRTREQWRK
jgi:hypothetical protein